MNQVDRVLDLWATRSKAADIANATGLNIHRVRHIVYAARSRGDVRAAKRGRKDGRPHANCMGIYRTQEQVKALKEMVLDAWAQGLSGDAIATARCIERGYVDAIVGRARRTGDPRAVARGRKDCGAHDTRVYRTKQQSIALRDAVLDAWVRGEEGSDIAKANGISSAYAYTIVDRGRASGDVRAQRRTA